MPGESRWTTLTDLRAASLRGWNRGELLRELLEPSGVYPRRRSLKKPTATELRDDYPAVRSWSAELFGAADCFAVETVEMGRNTIGSNPVPAAAVFSRVEDEIAFVAKTKGAAQAVALVRLLASLDPALRQWAVKRPLELLRLGDTALTAGRVALWLEQHPAPGIFVRQLSLPGVHTKFVEQHRRVIDEMVSVMRDQAVGDSASQASDVDPAHSGTLHSASAADVVRVAAGDVALGAGSAWTPAARFAQRHGFMHPPELVRFRLLDPDTALLGAARDITVTADAFSTMALPVHTVVVTENLVNFLALPERAGTVALFGKGYGFSALREAAWLQKCSVVYWGDLDTHGFHILDGLRSKHPHVISVLMDKATLLAHRDVWGSEPTPARAELTRLTEDESSLYRALRDGVYGPAVRLEQELIRWDWALERIAGP